MSNEVSGFLFTFVCSFVLLVVSALSLAFFARSFITKYRKRESEKMRSWVALAKEYGLEMHFDNGSQGGAYIEGDFCGHHLKLETFQRDTVSEISKTFTRLTLSIKEPLHNHGKEVSVKPTSQTIISTMRSSELNSKLVGRLDVDKYADVIRYEQTGVEVDVDYLSLLFELTRDIAETYCDIVALGGKVVALLTPLAMDKNNKFEGVIRHLLQDISKDTTNRLAHKAENLLCVTCLTRCAAHKFKLSTLETITYYGCRMCQQSRDFMEWEGVIVARLDKNMVVEHVYQNNDLHINWFTQDELFDFDKVEIIKATDEDVERFAIKVGNDTDPIRKSRYKKTPYKISLQNELSENTLKILKSMFDEVEIK